MTSWATFETIDEMAKHGNCSAVFVDRLGRHSFTKEDRTRFELELAPLPTGGFVWACIDLEEAGSYTTGTMKECVRWIAGRVLYGA